MKYFFLAVSKGVWFVLILTITSFAGVIRGVWIESDRLARLWESQLVMGGRTPPPPGYLSSIYYVVRMFAFALMIAYLILFSRLVEWIFVR
jgi:hypothetical protein